MTNGTDITRTKTYQYDSSNGLLFRKTLPGGVTTRVTQGTDTIVPKYAHNKVYEVSDPLYPGEVSGAWNRLDRVTYLSKSTIRRSIFKDCVSKGTYFHEYQHCHGLGESAAYMAGYLKGGYRYFKLYKDKLLEYWGKSGFNFKYNY